MTTFVTPTPVEKHGWSLLAMAAYAVSNNAVGNRYSVAASLSSNGQIDVARFDVLQGGYRRWLIDGVLPSIEGGR